MAQKERSLVKGIAIDTWGDIWRQPLMWLILSASFLPLVFLINFLLPGYVSPGASPTLQLALYFSGYCICFALYFLFWCMAVYLYDEQVRGKGRSACAAAFSRMKGIAWRSLLVGIFCGLIAVFAYQLAQIVANLLISFLYSGQNSAGSLFLLEMIGYYVSFIVADFIVVFLALTPQMLALEGGSKVDEVLRASYQLVKARYRDAIILIIIPELFVRTLFIGVIYGIVSSRGGYLIFVALLLSMVLLEGARTAFVAAAFNRFYYHILEEEKKKKRKAKAKAKKQVAKKKSAKGKGGKR